MKTILLTLALIVATATTSTAVTQEVEELLEIYLIQGNYLQPDTAVMQHFDSDSIYKTDIVCEGKTYTYIMAYSGDTECGPIFLPGTKTMVGENGDGDFIFNAPNHETRTVKCTGEFIELSTEWFDEDIVLKNIGTDLTDICSDDTSNKEELSICLEEAEVWENWYYQNYCGLSGGEPAYKYPITTRIKAQAALSYAYWAKNPAGIKECVCKHYNFPSCVPKELFDKEHEITCMNGITITFSLPDFEVLGAEMQEYPKSTHEWEKYPEYINDAKDLCK